MSARAVWTGLAAVCVDEAAQPPATHLVYYGTPAWEALLDWVRFHGLDPDRILGSGARIIRNERHHVIAYTALVLDDDGHKVPDGIGGFRTVDCIERGEAGPLPFPELVTRAALPAQHTETAEPEGGSK